ncbi:MAG: NADP-dependent oxidoreductase [Beijerinckiaceae bacterium]
MKAAFITAAGGTDKFAYGDLPDPVAGPGEILVDIHAASVNGADWKSRENAYGLKMTFPYILGRDFSGVVAALGEGVTDFAVGDEVFGVCAAGQEGTYCEKIAMKAELCAKKPGTLSHVDAAALALIGLTALVSVEDTLKLQKGETILVQGGAGGVAGFAIQLAKHLGARTITTCSAKNVDYVRGLGADEVIDYSKQDFTQRGPVCDCVFDTVGGDVAKKAFAVLKPGGRAAFIASGNTAPKPERPDVTSLRPAVGRDREHLQRICDLYAAGAVTVPEVTLFALSDVVRAHEVSEGRHLRGKLVFKIK